VITTNSEYNRRILDTKNTIQQAIDHLEGQKREAAKISQQCKEAQVNSKIDITSLKHFTMVNQDASKE
jgi:hypothetical protein